MLGIWGLLLAFGYVVNDGTWAWLEYQAIVSKSLSVVIILSVYLVYLLLVFGVVTPTSKQVLVRGSLYIVFIVGVMIASFFIRSYLPNSIASGILATITVCLGYMLLYSIYIVLNYGVIDKNAHQPLIVRIGNVTLSLGDKSGANVPVPWLIFVLIPGSNMDIALYSILNAFLSNISFSRL